MAEKEPKYIVCKRKKILVKTIYDLNVVDSVTDQPKGIVYKQMILHLTNEREYIDNETSKRMIIREFHTVPGGDGYVMDITHDNVDSAWAAFDLLSEEEENVLKLLYDFDLYEEVKTLNFITTGFKKEP